MAAVRSLCTHLDLVHQSLSRTICAKHSDRFRITHHRGKNRYTIHVPERQPEDVFRSVLRGLAVIHHQPPDLLCWYDDFASQLPLLRQTTGQKRTMSFTSTPSKKMKMSTPDTSTSSKTSSPKMGSCTSLWERMTLFRDWERREEQRCWDPGEALRSMAVVQATRLLDPDCAFTNIQYTVVWTDKLKGPWRCQQTAPHRYTIFLHRGHLLAMVCTGATLEVGGVHAPTFSTAVLLLVLQAMTRILTRQAGADKHTLLRRSGLASLHSRLLAR